MDGVVIIYLPTSTQSSKDKKQDLQQHKTCQRGQLQLHKNCTTRWKLIEGLQNKKGAIAYTAKVTSIIKIWLDANVREFRVILPESPSNSPFQILQFNSTIY